MAQKIIQMQMRHLYFNLKDLFSNRKGFVILTSLLRFKNKSREFREKFRTFEIGHHFDFTDFHQPSSPKILLELPQQIVRHLPSSVDSKYYRPTTYPLAGPIHSILPLNMKQTVLFPDMKESSYNIRTCR